ncbi:MAG: hypothetical protein K2X74_00425 [Acetobacteraceae bacterium]|nr:hypothetical protein [Acetobacteraceae bacterium]
MTADEREVATAHAYRTLLDPREPNARLIWADLAANYYVGTSSHVAGDAHASAFREGQRAVFLYLAGRAGIPLIMEP